MKNAIVWPALWAENNVEIGDKIYSPVHGRCTVVQLEGEQKPAKEEEVPAWQLKVGDEIWYDNEWRTVLSVYCHIKSCYQEPNLSQSNSTIPLSVRMDKNLKIRRKTENYIMSVNLLTSHDLVKELQVKLIDYSALNDAPDRIEAVQSVFIDKVPVMHALKKEIQAVYAKLGENIKKI
ncbi:hypothetical protein AC4HA13_0014 [Escherichia phage vB_EcoM_4HA13]|uniref:Uncharacterized protein n=1 Tax=Escherichia phage vB_EcoM_4HA13 TaxID=2601675 RepID=A0A7D0NGU0_9CAUD|nr:hypothetical protein HYP96_gp14 [Escherichia phage vB_EcoM_4HA13]QEM42985.1 hypothetical protein AC4HA13_0014 [Escherichia phage vB_EcoM_4HA13]